MYDIPLAYKPWALRNRAKHTGLTLLMPTTTPIPMQTPTQESNSFVAPVCKSSRDKKYCVYTIAYVFISIQQLQEFGLKILKLCH